MGLAIKLTQSEFENRCVCRNVTPLGLYVNAKTKTSFRCNVCSNEWQAAPNNFFNCGGCPKCGLERSATKRRKDRSEIRQALLKRGIDVLSKDDEIQSMSNKCNFACKVCQNTWTTSLDSVIYGTGCANCLHKRIGSIKKMRCSARLDEFLKTVPIKRIGDFRGATKNTKFECEICGHAWSPRPSNVMSGTGCPHCKFKNENSLFGILSGKFGADNVDRHVMVAKTPRRFADFIVKTPSGKVWVEYDGEQHFGPVKFFGGANKFARQQIIDKRDEEISSSENLRLFRIPYFENKASAVDAIAKQIEGQF